MDAGGGKHEAGKGKQYARDSTWWTERFIRRVIVSPIRRVEVVREIGRADGMVVVVVVQADGPRGARTIRGPVVFRRTDGERREQEQQQRSHRDVLPVVAYTHSSGAARGALCSTD